MAIAEAPREAPSVSVPPERVDGSPFDQNFLPPGIVGRHRIVKGISITTTRNNGVYELTFKYEPIKIDRKMIDLTRQTKASNWSDAADELARLLVQDRQWVDLYRDDTSLRRNRIIIAIGNQLPIERIPSIL